MTQTIECRPLTSEAEEATRLLDLHDQRVALAKSFADHDRPTGAMAAAVMAKGAELDAECEAFRRKHYPRRYRILAVQGTVFSVSFTGRTSPIYDGQVE